VSALKSRWRRAAVVVAAIACLALGAAIAAFIAGVTLDASRWRDAAAQRASTALGRPVTLQGALQLTLGRELVLRIGDVRILNPTGFSAREFASIGLAKVRVDLLDALRGRPRLRGVEASDIGVWLERASDGRGNWSFSQPQDPASTRAGIDVGLLKLERLAVHYRDPRSAAPHTFELDELSGSVGRNDPLRLALRARVDKRIPYRLRIEGATLQQLLQASEPWPFTLDLKSSGGWLHADGTLDARQGEARFHLGAGADDLAQAGRLLGASLPQLGAATLSGSVVARADEIAVTRLQGLFGEAEFSGQLTLSFAGARQRLSGALSIAKVDLRPFLGPDAQPPGEPPIEAWTWQALPLRDLVPTDLALDLSVGRWLGLPVGVKDAKLALRADRLGMRSPLSATIAGTELSGHLELDLAATTPTLALRLEAREFVLGGLAREHPELRGLEGTLGRASLRLGGRGDTLGAVLPDLEMSFAVAAGQMSYRNAVGARPIAVTLDSMRMDAGRGQRLRGSARGSLLGEHAKLSIRGGMVPEMLHERAMPLELDLALAQTSLRVQGVLARAEETPDTALRFDLQARRSGDLARWLSVAPESNLPVAVRGRVRATRDAWHLDETTLELGRSRLRIDAHRTRAAGRPFTTATVRSPLIDLAELSTLRASVNAPARAGARLDAPILSTAIDLADADLELDLQHVGLGRTDLVDVGFVARTRQGRLLPSPLRGKLAGNPFTGLIELDLAGEVPSAKLDLSTGEIDVGALLRGLGVAEDINGRADSLELTLRGRGNSLREVAANTALEAMVVGGSVTVLGAAQRPVTEIRVREAVIGAAAGQPLQMRLNGTLDQSAVRIQLSTGSFADFVGDATRVPFSMTAQAAGARLSLDGEVTLPLGSAGQLSFEIAGERLDTLSELARVELPAWGPWSLSSPIRMTSTGYELQGLTVAVGQSRLGGSGTLDLSGPRPRLQMQVAAPTLQLDDFPMPPRLADPSESPLQGESLRGATTRLAGRVDRLLSARFLRRFDATVDVQASEVLSGTDRLADGALHLKLQDGRLDLDPAVLNLPGGGLRLSMAYDLKESEVDLHVAAYVERFDYGIIARRLNRSDDLRGLFSMNLELAGRAPSLDSIMRSANGKLDLAVWPTELRSGMFNLWSANLVLTLLPLIDPGLKSQVNCIVGRFDLKEGDLSDDKILIDTSTVRIRGTGHANLRTEELAFVFRPRAKGIGLFRLQTPLRVSGTLTDQRFGFDRQDVFYSALRMVASPILVPIQWFTLGPMSRDGADVCNDPLRTAAR
jgi:uncharacterized protein involved in outer membrane biogenesis